MRSNILGAPRVSWGVPVPATLECPHVVFRECSLPAPAIPLRTVSQPSSKDASPIAGSVLPLQAAEDLVATLPGVLSARIIPSPSGSVQEIHVLTTTEFTPKQTVRNIESALMAHLGLKVDHRKVSVAMSEAKKSKDDAAKSEPAPNPGRPTPASVTALPGASTALMGPAEVLEAHRRRLYFEDVEVRRSRQRGVTCRVTLRKGDELFVGEAEGMETERGRVELSARAALHAIALAEASAKALALDGVKVIEAFDREFAFVAVSARVGRDTSLLTGSCEVKEGAETAAVLAVLDATNRWVTLAK